METTTLLNYSNETIKNTLNNCVIMSESQVEYANNVIIQLKDIVNNNLQSYYMDIVYDITSILTRYVPNGVKSVIYFTRNYGTCMTCSSDIDNIMEYYNLWKDSINGIYVIALQPHDDNIQDIIKCDDIEHAWSVYTNNIEYIK